METRPESSVDDVVIVKHISRDVDTDKLAPLLHLKLDKGSKAYIYFVVEVANPETVDISDVSVDTNSRPI